MDVVGVIVEVSTSALFLSAHTQDYVMYLCLCMCVCACVCMCMYIVVTRVILGLEDTNRIELITN